MKENRHGVVSYPKPTSLLVSFGKGCVRSVNKGMGQGKRGPNGMLANQVSLNPLPSSFLGHIASQSLSRLSMFRNQGS